ncbi:MAG: hypothetical protein KDA24_28015 [Deltaproteobacteria bacterium]|nr:hypothetical protein [Deltaproteobacteria bacterium]
MSLTKFVGTFLQATFFGGTYDDVAFEVRVLKGEVARLHERLDKDLARLEQRLDALDAGKPAGARGKSRLRIMTSAEAADVADTKVETAGVEPSLVPPAVTRSTPPSAGAGLRTHATDAGDAKPPHFRPDMSIAAAWRAHPKAPSVFASHHLPGCIDCPLCEGETVEEGAALHSLDAAALLADLERLVTA